jgi:hypothetical protein
MRQQAGRLKRMLAGFEGTVSTFQALGVLTSIETARLGGAGADFGNLAEDVKSAAGSIKSKVETALETGAHLIAPIEEVLQGVSVIQKRQEQDLPLLISKATASLSSLRDIQDKTYDASVRLRTKYDAISQAFNKMIVSIQYHDITQQQVEHVIDALRRLCFESGQEGDNISNDPRSTAVVLKLQSMQLSDAGEKFAALVASVAQNLEQIAVSVLEMAGESRTLSGLSADETDSFFLEMERGCTNILASLSQCATGRDAVRGSTVGLAATIGRMRGPIDEIRTIEIQMHRMAMNARISAFHLGSTGDALGILASSLQRVAIQCGERSELLLEALGSINESATRLSDQGGGPTPSGDTSSPDGSLQAMDTTVAELHSASERSFSQIAHIVAHCGRLREDLSATRETFSVGPLFAETISRARGMLQEIGQTNQSAWPDGTETLEQGLADFAKHYTMHSERYVHEGLTKAFVGAAPVAAQNEQSQLPPTGAEELGENVEFF